MLPRGHVSVPRCRAVPLDQFQFGLVSASAARPSLGAGAREGEAVASEASGRRRAVLSLPLAGPRFPRRRTGKERRPGPARFPASLRHSSSGTRVPGSVPNARDTMGRRVDRSAEYWTWAYGLYPPLPPGTSRPPYSHSHRTDTETEVTEATLPAKATERAGGRAAVWAQLTLVLVAWTAPSSATPSRHHVHPCGPPHS